MDISAEGFSSSSELNVLFINWVGTKAYQTSAAELKNFG